MKASDVRRRYEVSLLGLPGVVMVGDGRKITKGKMTDEDAVIVFVVEKKPLSELRPWEIVPQALEGVKTDVMVSRVVRAPPVGLRAAGDPTGRWRPAHGGVSIGHYAITAGTLGCVVKKPDGRLYALSNNHVLANSNQGKIGDAVYQPGPYDGGGEADRLGWLSEFVPINFDPLACPIAGGACSAMNALARLAGRETRVVVESGGIALAGANTVDCALMAPDDEADLFPDILEIGKLTGDVVPAVVGMQVQKFGRTTGYTTGNVLAINTTAKVSYGTGVAVFTNQIVAGPMSAGGDSGSAVPDMYNNPSGLLFAGSDEVTIFNEIGRALDAFDVQIA